MELFLNILWVLIALASLGLWRGVWKSEQRHRQHAPIEEWTAFAVILVFLFFAVSLSDDLHAAAIVSDDSGGRRHSRVCHCPDHASRDLVTAHASALALLANPPAQPSFRVVTRIAPRTESVATRTEIESPSSRAPPFHSL
jgi:hypothetical protein